MMEKLQEALHGFVPMTLLGFSFYWAWIFSCTASSTSFGSVFLANGISFEVCYIACRALAMLVVALLIPRITPGIELPLACFGGIVGTASTALLGLAGHEAPTGGLVAICLGMGASDAAIFSLWLSLFCYSGSRHTILNLGTSYAGGALISLVPFILLSPYNIVIGAALPLAAALSFLATSSRLRSRGTRPGEAEPLSAADSEQEQAASGADASREPLRTPESRPSSQAPSARHFLPRIVAALSAYGVVFGVFKALPIAIAYHSALASATSQIFACLIMGAIMLGICLFAKSPGSEYSMFRIIPIAFALGLAISLPLDDRLFPWASLASSIAYNIFEMLCFGAIVDTAQSRKANPLRSISIARTLNSFGLFAGMTITSYATIMAPSPQAVHVILVCSLILVVAVSTLVFGDHELRSAIDLAETNETNDEERRALSKQRLRELLAERYGLTSREKEVLEYLAKGRNAHYIAEQLFISEGTVKSHIARIYRKMGIHTQQELLDITEKR